jgi:hypothetical protein
MMLPTTINQRLSLILNEQLVFEYQFFVTWNFKRKPTTDLERDRKINSHIVYVARQSKAHIFPYVGVNHTLGHASSLRYGERNIHGHGLLLSDKFIDFKFMIESWKHGSFEVSVFKPRDFLTKFGSDALSYIQEKHDYRPMTMVCPRHNKRACGKTCRWLKHSLMKPSISQQDAILLKMGVNIW